MPDPKPHHRRAAAEALYPSLPIPPVTQSWIESGNWYGFQSVTTEAIAQAIAVAEERGRREERARLLGDCKFFEVDVDGRFTEHDRLCDAENEAEASLEGALECDNAWSEGTESIGYGALVYLGHAVATNRRPAPEGSGFDELIDYVLKTTDAEMGRELDKSAALEGKP